MAWDDDDIDIDIDADEGDWTDEEDPNNCAVCHQPLCQHCWYCHVCDIALIESLQPDFFEVCYPRHPKSDPNLWLPEGL